MSGPVPSPSINGIIGLFGTFNSLFSTVIFCASFILIYPPQCLCTLHIIAYFHYKCYFPFKYLHQKIPLLLKEGIFIIFMNDLLKKHSLVYSVLYILHVAY